MGDSYFNKAGKGDINIYLDRLQYDLDHIGDRGVVGMITGNHDIPRLAYQRTTEEVKAAMVFLFTMPGVPFVYYGDEIGMDYLDTLTSKEGGYSRTGTRTPMQWDNSKNHGFSDSDTPYLPTDTRPGAPTVAEQEQDTDSLLSFVKGLIRLHRQTPALYAEADFAVLQTGYPFVYTRKAEGKTIFVAINPSDKSCSIELPSVKQVLLEQNVSMQDKLELGGISFIVAEISE